MILCKSRLETLDRVQRMVERSSWTGLGSFNFGVNLPFVRYLPKGSQLIIGLPEQQAVTLEFQLRWLKTSRPDLIIVTSKNSHAKYGLFYTKREKWAMIGSANMSFLEKMDELVYFSKDEELYNKVAKFHETLLSKGTSVLPSPKPLSASALKDLRTLTVGPKTVG